MSYWVIIEMSDRAVQKKTGLSTSKLISVALDPKAEITGRITACRAMASLGYRMFGPVLLRIVRKSSGRLAKEAERSLRLIPGGWSLKLQDDVANKRGKTLKRKLRARTNRELVGIAVDPSRNVEERRQSLLALSDLRARSVSKELVPLLEDDDPSLSNAVAHALRSMQDTTVSDILVRVLRNSNKEHARMEAAYALGSMWKKTSLA